MVLAVRKLGYLEYLAMDKIYGWFCDMIDVPGINRDGAVSLTCSFVSRHRIAAKRCGSKPVPPCVTSALIMPDS